MKVCQVSSIYSDMEPSSHPLLAAGHANCRGYLHIFSYLSAERFTNLNLNLRTQKKGIGIELVIYQKIITNNIYCITT